MPKREEPKKQLTDRTIKAAKPAKPGKRKLLWDALVPGLALRVTDKGKKTFVLIKRYPGSKHPVPRAIGEYGAISLEAARDRARDWIELLRKGTDPAAEAERHRQAELRKQANSFIAVAEAYIAHIHREGQRKAAVVERQLRREFIPRWNSRPVTSITKTDVSAVVREVLARGAKYEAHNLFGVIRTLFAWAIAVGDYGLEASPCDRLKPKALIGEKRARTRILADAELQALWRASGKLPYPYGPLYRLLLLTGQRKSEVAEARWREFDLKKKIWTIPAERMKMANAHVVPLTDDVIAILKSLPRFKKGDYVFSTRFGAIPVNGFSKSKTILDKAILSELRADNPDAELPPFVTHDLRRTMRTHLAALPIAPLVAERVIAHAKQGLDRIYNLHEYFAEKKHALELWNARLRGIVEPPSGNVVSLRG
jgi:integrase